MKEKTNSKILEAQHEKQEKMNQGGKRLLSKGQSARILFKPFKEVNWGVECVKALLTSTVFLLLSTLFVWIVLRNSPGEYSGERLESYLLKEIARDANVPYNKGSFALNKKLDSAEGRIVVCGDYCNNNQNVWDSCFIYIFERAPKSFWNTLIGTAPRYKAVLSLTSTESFYSISRFCCLKCDYRDIDGDNYPEIEIFYQCHFADRVTNACVVLQRIGGQWTAIAPDFSDLEAELMKEKITCDVLVDEFHFSNPHKSDSDIITFYGQSHNGYIYEIENEIWGGYDWLYCITANDGTTGYLNSDKTVLVMERITNHGIFRDPNWNKGDALYISAADIDMEHDVSSRWGIQLDDGVIFYGDDVK